MKIFGFYITNDDYAGKYVSKCRECEALEQVASRKSKELEETQVYYADLRKKKDHLEFQLSEQLKVTIMRDEDIKDLRRRIEEAKSSNEKLAERLSKEMTSNCELQNLYADKCKECEGLKVENNGIVMTEEEYNKLKADAEKFRADREKHNANRRKKRAAKKVAHAQPHNI